MSLLFFSCIITWLLPLNAEIGQADVGRLDAGLLQIFHRAMIVRCVIGGLAHYHQDRHLEVRQLAGGLACFQQVRRLGPSGFSSFTNFISEAS